MIQLDLFGCTLQQQFDVWVHTPQGRAVADRFIRLAYGLHKRGLRMGAKAIWERLRWSYEVRRQPGECFALNNNYTAYMARFAMQREPSLAGFFDLREPQLKHPSRAVVVPIHTARRVGQGG